MASNDKKKQRREAKRKQKQHARRKQASVSPIRRLAEAKGDLECWASTDFESMGQIQMFVFKQGGGLSGVASFLVDRGVVGLKDAWTRLNFDRVELAEIIRRSEERGIAMQRVGLDEVRHWVAGGVKWASMFGMRLPKDWQKAAALLGGVIDVAAADVSAFAKEFAGNPEDLRQRLIGEPLDSFLARTDIEFILDESAPFMDQQTGEYQQLPDEFDFDDDDGTGDDDDELDEATIELAEETLRAALDRMAPTARGLAAETAAWLPPGEGAPSEELFEAWRLIMFSLIASKEAIPVSEDDDQELQDEQADLGFKMLKDLGTRIEPARQAEFHRAVGQALHHLETNPNMMQRATLQFGFDDGPSDAGSLEDE